MEAYRRGLSELRNRVAANDVLELDLSNRGCLFISIFSLCACVSFLND